METAHSSLPNNVIKVVMGNVNGTCFETDNKIEFFYFAVGKTMIIAWTYFSNKNIHKITGILLGRNMLHEIRLTTL
jgi:hypothetical protein